jgi:hypothetical protein
MAKELETEAKITDKLVIAENGKITQEIPKKYLENRKEMLQKRSNNIDTQISELQDEKNKILAKITELDTFIKNVEAIENIKK